MRTKVYIKREDYDSNMPRYLIFIFFFSIGILVFKNCLNAGSYEKVIESIIGNGIVLAFLFGVSIFLIYFYLKKPHLYAGTLREKIIEEYKGKKITYMIFDTVKEAVSSFDLIDTEYRCYTIGENDLKEGSVYVVGIKEFDWRPKFVEPIGDKDQEKMKIPTTNNKIVIYIVLGFFAYQFFLCIYGIIKYPEYTGTYLIVAAFLAVGLITSYITYKDLFK